MEDLISQLTAASQEQQTVVKKHQNVNKALIKEQEKKEQVIKELGKELRKTKFASENSKVERGNSNSFQKKLEENERQLIGANTTIKILKQEKEKIEKRLRKEQKQIYQSVENAYVLKKRKWKNYMNNRNNKGEKM